MNILTEASGSLTSGYLIKAIRNAGYRAIASDVDDDNAGRYIADDYIRMPYSHDPELWSKTYDLLQRHNVKVVIPSLDETLLGWAERKNELSAMGIHVVISPPETIRIFQDKWLTYQFFCENGIPTPNSSLEQRYSVIKPRYGRGGKGILYTTQTVDMSGMISQEQVSGDEYTIDVLCDHDGTPVYIIPRKRLKVRDGKSTGGVTVYHEGIINWVKQICSLVKFHGPINFQCFVQNNGDIKFIEINPRIAGGMALGFAASENWIPLIINHILKEKPINPKEVHYGLKMLRFYDEIFI